MAQVSTAPPPSIPWDNPFSHVPVTVPTRTASSPQWLKDLDEKGVGSGSHHDHCLNTNPFLVGYHPQGHLERSGRLLRRRSYQMVGRLQLWVQAR